MADNVIGDAVIEVGADGAKFRDDVDGLTAQGPSVGEKMSSLVGKTLKAGLIAVGAVAGAALAKTMFGGFNRLADIDQAKKKLEGLGNSGKDIETIMQNALAAVKGTAFGLDEAATISANLVAAGIKPGNSLEQALKTVANTASVAGVSMTEVGDIFTEVAALGKVTGDSLMRLETRGIPATQLLAEALGKTREETRKMVAAGVIDMDTFAGAINSTMGSAALVAGESFRGMLSNIGASMNRLGAVTLTPVFEGVKTVMPSVIALFDRAAEALKPLVEKITPQVQAFFGWLKGAIDGISFDGIGLSASSLFDIMSNVSASVQDIVMNLITQLPTLMTEVLPKMADAVISKASFLVQAMTEVIEGATAALDGLLPILVDTFIQFLPDLVNSIVGLIPLVVMAITSLIQAVVAILPVLLPALIEGAVALFMALVQALVVVVPLLLQAVLNILPVIITTLLGMLPMLLASATQLFIMLVQAVIDILPVLIQTIMDILPDILAAVVAMLPDLLDAAVELFLALVQGVIDILPVLLDTIFGMLPDIIVAVLNMLPQLIDAAFQLFYGLILGLLDMLPQLLTTIISLAPKMGAAIIKMLPDIIEAAIDLFLGLVKGLIKFTPQLLKALWDLGPQMVSAIGDLFGQLRDAGKNLIDGLIKGVGDMAGRVVDKVKSVASGALDAVKNFFGINSPSKVFAGIGHGLGEGLIKGVGEMTKPVEKAVRDMVGDIPKQASIDITRNLLPASGAPTTFPGRSDAAYQTEQMIAAQKATGARTYGDVHVSLTVPLEDLAQLKDLEAFLEMVRVRSRMGSDGSDD